VLFVGCCAVSAGLAEADPGYPVQLAWDANPESTVIGYYVYVGTTSGLYTQSYDVGNTTTYNFTAGTPGQQYFFAIAAYVSGSIQGPRSSEVSATVVANPSGGSSGGGSGGGTSGGGSSGGGGGGGGGGTTSTSTQTTSSPVTGAAPPSPTSAGPGVVLQPALVSGTSVTLQWAAVGGLSVLEYVIEAGSAAGLSNIYNGSIGTANLVNAIVGEATYFVRIRARTGATTSVTSNEISFSVGFQGVSACSTPPATPVAVNASVIGGQTASVSWQPVPGATSYIIAAGSAPGFSDVYYGDVGNTVAVTAPVSAGFTAYVRVIAVNACGQSVASSDVYMQ